MNTDINENDVKEFTEMGENIPKVGKPLTEEEQRAVVDAIANADIAPIEKLPSNEPMMIGCTEVCPHCDNEQHFVVPVDRMITNCAFCGKAIVVCDKCRRDDESCSQCIWCDVANLYNVLLGNAKIKDFLANLTPGMIDYTKAKEDSPKSPADLTFEDYQNCDYDDKFEWDYGYWGAYEKVARTSLTPDSTERELVEFIKSLNPANKSK